MKTLYLVFQWHVIFTVRGFLVVDPLPLGACCVSVGCRGLLQKEG